MAAAIKHAFSIKYLRGILAYSPETGVFTWKYRNDVPKQINSSKADKVAGQVSTRGYIKIGLNGRVLLGHRLAWFYVHGTWPLKEIDHINGDKADNRIANLRIATRHENHCNSKANSNNTSGYKSVSFDKRKKKYRARIFVNGKRLSLGSHSSPKEAHAAYLEAAKKHYGAFANGG